VLSGHVEPGDRVAVTVPGYPPYRHSSPRSLRAGAYLESSENPDIALTAKPVLAAHRKTPLNWCCFGIPPMPTAP